VTDKWLTPLYGKSLFPHILHLLGVSHLSGCSCSVLVPVRYSCDNLAFRNDNPADGRHAVHEKQRRRFAPRRALHGDGVTAPLCSILVRCARRWAYLSGCSCGNVLFRNVIAAGSVHCSQAAAQAVRLTRRGPHVRAWRPGRFRWGVPLVLLWQQLCRPAVVV
jgi:hypothetical protein